jgi:CMP-N-acetylneuraminic acid synthetase
MCAQWTVEAALAAAGVERVVVSSDCPRLRELAAGMGVGFVERPEALAGDGARVDDAARHAVLEADGAGRFGRVVLLYANVPVRPAGLIDEALGMLDETGCDSVQSYAPVGKHHPWWCASLGDAGEVSAFGGGVLNGGVYRRQELPAAYVPDGGVIALTREALMLEVAGAGGGPHACFGRDRRGVVNEEGAVVDIDCEVDLALAEVVLSRRSGLSGECAA